MKPEPESDLLITMRDAEKRYGVTKRSIEYWVADADLAFPKPRLLRRRRYFSLAELEKFERRFTDRFGARVEAAA